MIEVTATPRPGVAGPLIFVVEDDIGVAQLVVRMLESLHFQVRRIGEGGLLKRARQGQNGLDMQNWAPGQNVELLERRPTVVHADIGMREALQIRYQTGNKLVLQDNDKVVGILGDTELYHALLGKNHG